MLSTTKSFAQSLAIQHMPRTEMNKFKKMYKEEYLDIKKYVNKTPMFNTDNGCESLDNSLAVGEEDIANTKYEGKNIRLNNIIWWLVVSEKADEVCGGIRQDNITAINKFFNSGAITKYINSSNNPFIFKRLTANYGEISEK
jgi:hypothetical protein